MYSEIVINKAYQGINPVLFGYQTCEPSHAYGPVARTHWLFHFVVSGHGIFRIGGRDYRLSKGMMFVIPPFVETYYEADAEEPWEYIWIGFTGEPPLTLSDTYTVPQALRIFESMKISHNLNEGRTEFLLGKLWELFSLLMEQTHSGIDPVEMALNIIHAEYMTPLTVQQIANRIHLERTYFSNLFLGRVGRSPKRYLTDYRMEQALVLLQQGYSVTVTALSVGYQDVYAFSKAFKRQFGVPPTAYGTIEMHVRQCQENLTEVTGMENQKTSLVFTGDIGFDRYMEGKWEDEALLSQSVLEFFRSADHTVANVEGAVMDIVNDGSRGAFFHTMDPKAIAVLKAIRADIWNIGNNHSMDAGKEGLVSTMAFAEQNGARTMGAGLTLAEASAPLYLDEAGGIGMFCTMYVSEEAIHSGKRLATKDHPGIFRWDDDETIAKRIAEVKATCRWCVVVCHGGEEFACMPSPYTRERYIRYLKWGADVVVAHHPHVPENYEIFEDGKAIFYSLGNFIFDTDYQRAHAYTDVGVLLKLIFTEDKLDFEAMGIRICRGDERIVEAPLPAIFENIPAADYERLIPWGVKAFIAEEKRRMVFLEPETYAEATDALWEDYFNGKPEGFFAGEHMDFRDLVPLAATAADSAWEDGRFGAVKEYILRLL